MPFTATVLLLVVIWKSDYTAATLAMLKRFPALAAVTCDFLDMDTHFRAHAG